MKYENNTIAQIAGLADLALWHLPPENYKDILVQIRDIASKAAVVEPGDWQVTSEGD